MSANERLAKTAINYFSRWIDSLRYIARYSKTLAQKAWHVMQVHTRDNFPERAAIYEARGVYAAPTI